GQDVGVLEVRGDADFAQEPFSAERGSHFGMEDLDGDGAIVLDVVREKHGRHAAAAHLALDLVGATESMSDQPADVGHTVLPRGGGITSPILREGRRVSEVNQLGGLLRLLAHSGHYAGPSESKA